MTTDECVLTVYCLVYNHAKYIRDTLEGFVNQETKYKYEVIVHDDASTDGSQEIIKEYAEKYPDIIKPVFQKENQYSKKVGIYKTFISPMISGKYAAICEGDDYWCDSSKLEKQIDYMEAHPECSLCVHNTEMIKETGEGMGILFNSSKTQQDYSVQEIIECGGGGLFHTSSFLYVKKIRDDRPRDFKMSGAGDYPLAIFLASRGTVHYFPDVMSKYRVNSKGSWTSKTSDKEKHEKTAQLHIAQIDNLDRLTDNKYTDSFSVAKDRIRYKVLMKENKLGTILSEKRYRRFLFEKGFAKGIKTMLKIMLKKN